MARVSLTSQQYLNSIGTLTAAAIELAARYNLNQLTWQPGAGERWSILECLDHLAISTGIYLDAMDISIGNARPGPEAGIFHTAGLPSTRFVNDLEPPVTRKLIRAPAKIRPRPTLHPEDILPQYLKAMERLTTAVTSSINKDLNAVRFRNPVIPLLRLTVASGFLISAAHGRRHMWQAEEVTKEPDFPR
jgi:hypothetical protein